MMSALEALHTQLEEVLRTEAVAAMAAYEAGIYQTQNKLDSCLGELRTVQATAEQQCQAKVQHIQAQYQQELEQLTQQYEEQVKMLEQSTKELVKAAQVEAEEVVTQAAAQLLYSLQQQQQAAAEAQGHAEPSADDIQELQPLQRQQLQKVQLQRAEQLQHEQPQSLEYLQLQGYLLHEPQQQQQQQEQAAEGSLKELQPSHQQQQQHHYHPQQHDPVQQSRQLWELELEQHRQSWQELEHREQVLQQQQQQQRISSPPSSAEAATSQHASAAAEQQQSAGWPAGGTSRYTTPRVLAAYNSISAPASLSASRRSSRTRNSNTDAGAEARWHRSHHTSSQQSTHQPPRQLLRALSATEVLRRASSSRQQLQQGLLEGLRRASEASSTPNNRETDSSRSSQSWSQLIGASRSRQLHKSSSARIATWETLAHAQPGAAAEAMLVRLSKPGLVSSGKEAHHLQQSRDSDSTPWLSSENSRSLGRLSSRGQNPVWSARKPTGALDLLGDESD